MGRNNYFRQMIDQRGSDWVTTVRPEEIQNATKRIVKDMVRGFIDYEKESSAFYDSKFIENLFIGVCNELEINTLNYNACKFYYQYYPNTVNMGPHIYHLERVIFIYTVIRDKINALRTTKNIGYLTDISGILFNDRNHLN